MTACAWRAHGVHAPKVTWSPCTQVEQDVKVQHIEKIVDEGLETLEAHWYVRRA